MAFPASMLEIEAPRIKIRQDGLSARRRFFADWADINQILAEVYVRSFASGNKPGPTNKVRFPGRPAMELQDVQINPFERDNVGGTDLSGVATCGSGAEVIFEYSTADMEDESHEDPKTGQQISMRVEGGVRVLKVSTEEGGDDGGFKYSVGTDADADDTNISDAAVVHTSIPIETWEVNWSNVPQPNWDILRTHKGTINNKPFLKADTGACLFTGFSAQDKLDANGEVTWDLTLQFEIQTMQFLNGATGKLETLTWNHIPRPEVDPTVDAHWETTTPLLFLQQDLAQIFSVDAVTDFRRAFLDHVFKGQTSSGFGKA